MNKPLREHMVNLFNLAINTPNLYITVVADDRRKLKFVYIDEAIMLLMDNEQLHKLVKYNRQRRSFGFFNGSVIDFLVYDTPQDAKSSKRHYLLMDCSVRADIQQQLTMRTSEQYWIF